MSLIDLSGLPAHPGGLVFADGNLDARRDLFGPALYILSLLLGYLAAAFWYRD
jgi:hypothetical protein